MGKGIFERFSAWFNKPTYLGWFTTDEIAKINKSNQPTVNKHYHLHLHKGDKENVVTTNRKGREIQAQTKQLHSDK